MRVGEILVRAGRASRPAGHFRIGLERLTHASVLTVALATGVLCSKTRAADWPQFRGPDRNGVSTETGLATRWPKDGPRLVWEMKVGEGYSGPVVAGERVVLFHRLGDREVVECLHAATGKPRWKLPYATSYQDQIGKGDGPRSTPVISGDKVYTLGAEGMLHCLELASGHKVWSRQINVDYKVPQNFFGVGTAPLIEGKLLLLNVGGKGAGIVAFNKDTGKEVWKATDDGASYSSPVAATIAGARLVFFLTRRGVLAMDPADGKVRFQKTWRARNPNSVNAATPVIAGDRVFFSASYETGALLLHVKKDGFEETWQGDDILSNHYETSIYHDGYLYGCDGRQETGAQLRCVEFKTGKVRWTKEGFGCGSMILADGQLIILTEKGDLVLVEPTPKAFHEKARASVLAKYCRAPIPLANGRLYARDDARLVCLDLRK
jgi:outer membrane protein assembly factor BamB